jgi:hypothetical protein
MRVITIVAVLLAASCASAKPKPPVVVPVPPPLPEYADGADAAKVSEARAAMDAARTRFYSDLEAFERKYHVSFSRGEGWDEIGVDGKPCINALDCRLLIRRIPPDPKKK